MTQHQAKLEEAIEQAKALQKAMKAGTMASKEIMAANQMGSMLLGSRLSMSKSPRGVSQVLYMTGFRCE